jgi:hypothetical protein
MPMMMTIMMTMMMFVYERTHSSTLLEVEVNATFFCFSLASYFCFLLDHPLVCTGTTGSISIRVCCWIRIRIRIIYLWDCLSHLVLKVVLVPEWHCLTVSSVLTYGRIFYLFYVPVFTLVSSLHKSRPSKKLPYFIFCSCFGDTVILHAIAMECNWNEKDTKFWSSKLLTTVVLVILYR